MVQSVSHKSAKIAALIDNLRGRDLDPHYLGYFECFNEQLFFEAHEVLEELWLAQRGQANDLFYKGLIQLAGAFVHIQKKRPGPALALFRLAHANLLRYPATHEGLRVDAVRKLIQDWKEGLESEETRGKFLADESRSRILLERPDFPAAARKNDQ
jgi:predicted metal-dependent hydrolase